MVDWYRLELRRSPSYTCYLKKMGWRSNAQESLNNSQHWLFKKLLPIGWNYADVRKQESIKLAISWNMEKQVKSRDWMESKQILVSMPSIHHLILKATLGDRQNIYNISFFSPLFLHSPPFFVKVRLMVFRKFKLPRRVESDLQTQAFYSKNLSELNTPF